MYELSVRSYEIISHPEDIPVRFVQDDTKSGEHETPFIVIDESRLVMKGVGGVRKYTNAELGNIITQNGMRPPNGKAQRIQFIKEQILK